MYEARGLYGRRGGDLADACAEPDEGGVSPALGQPKAPPSDGEEGELVDVAAARQAAPGRPERGGPTPCGGALLDAADRTRSGAEEWEVL